MSPARVPVWDLAVRIFHWSLVTGVTIAWFTGGTGDRLHEMAGFTVAGLIAFRLAWGLGGTRYARFGSFTHGPGTILSYLRAVARMRAPRHLGHNPAGGAMIIALLLLLVVISVSGIMQLTPRFFGVPWVEDLHHYAANTLVVLIPLHVLGVIVSSWMHQENLVGAMITGSKPAYEPEPVSAVERDRRIHDRVKGSEGLIILLALAAGGALTGYNFTSGRTATPGDSAAATLETAPTPQVIAVAAAVQQRAGSSAKEKQDYVAGGPANASRTWLVSSGGRLYDNWFVSLGVDQPTTRNPNFPAANTDVPDADTWRCKTCHGWDYLGRDGQYRNGPNATGIMGLTRAKTYQLDAIMTVLGSRTHGFTNDMLPEDAKFRLALFVKDGQHTTRNYFGPNGEVRGNPSPGQGDLRERLRRVSRLRRQGARASAPRPISSFKGNPLYVGSKAVANPVEVLHKIRNGHPGAIMVSLRGFPIDQAVNVLSYAQTLPVR